MQAVGFTRCARSFGPLAGPTFKRKRLFAKFCKKKDRLFYLKKTA